MRISEEWLSCSLKPNRHGGKLLLMIRELPALSFHPLTDDFFVFHDFLFCCYWQKGGLTQSVATPFVSNPLVQVGTSVSFQASHSKVGLHNNDNVWFPSFIASAQVSLGVWQTAQIKPVYSASLEACSISLCCVSVVFLASPKSITD